MIFPANHRVSIRLVKESGLGNRRLPVIDRKQPAHGHTNPGLNASWWIWVIRHIQVLGRRLQIKLEFEPVIHRRLGGQHLETGNSSI